MKKRRFGLEELHLTSTPDVQSAVWEDIVNLTPSASLYLVEMSVSDSPLYNYVLLVEVRNRKGEVEWAAGVPFDSYEDLDHVKDILLDRQQILSSGSDIDSIIYNVHHLLLPFLEDKHAIFYGVRHNSYQKLSRFDKFMDYYSKLAESFQVDNSDIYDAAEIMIAIYSGTGSESSAVIFGLKYLATEILLELLDQDVPMQEAINFAKSSFIVDELYAVIQKRFEEYSDNFAPILKKVDWNTIVEKVAPSVLQSYQNIGGDYAEAV